MDSARSAVEAAGIDYGYRNRYQGRFEGPCHKSFSRIRGKS